MQRRHSAYKVRSKTAGEGMLNNEGTNITAEEKRKMMRRKSSVPENLYVYEITIPDIEEGFDDIIYYRIVIKAIGNIEWNLFRRYSDFFDVHTDISLELTTIVFESEFPKKDFKSWFGSLRKKEIDKRRRMLQDWLQEFLSITNGSVRPENAKPEEVTRMQEKLDAFLEVKEKIRAHTISQAAKLEPAVDESAIAIYGAATPAIVVPKVVMVAPVASLSSVFGTFTDADDHSDSDIDGDIDGGGNEHEGDSNDENAGVHTDTDDMKMMTDGVDGSAHVNDDGIEYEE
jgi:hypothetical protein